MEGPTTSYDQPLEDGDVCRVCRSGAPEDGELFWPCQCSGSMRFVHETCLNDWIAARGSRPSPKCELCHTPLTFTKVFAPHMPSRLPLHLLAHHILCTFARAILLTLRALLVAVSWLAILPYSIVCVFRSLLWTADMLGTAVLALAGRSLKELRDPSTAGRVGSTIKMVKSAVESTSQPIEQLKEGLIANITAVSVNWTTGEKSLVLEKTAQALTKAEEVLKCQAQAARAISINPIGNLTALAARQSMLRAQGAELTPLQKAASTFISDVFRGQIITSIVVVLFVVCFLLREWIAMNAPVVNPPPAAQPDALVANMADAFRAGEIAAVVAHLQQQQQVAQDPAPTQYTGPPLQLPAEVLAALNEKPEQDDLIGDSQETGEEQEPEGWEEDEQPVASTSRLRLGQSPSPFAPGFSGIDAALEESTWEDVSDEEVEEALIPGRRRSKAIAQDSEDEWSAGAVRSGRRGSTEAARRRREERTSREERDRRRELRRASTGPGFITAPSSPDRPIRPLPGPRARATTPAREREFVLNPYRQPGPDTTFMFQLDQPPPRAFQYDGPPPPLQLAPPPPPPLPPAHGFEEQDFAADGEDVFVEDIFDDLNGILEAVGMKGPMLTLVQNLGLMILLITVCLLGGVWLPLTFGRALAAAKAVRLVTLPLRAVRTISDPLFDALFNLVAAIPKALFRVFAPRLVQLCGSLPIVIAEACMSTFSASTTSLAESAAAISPNVESSLVSDSAIGAPALPVAATALKRTLSTIALHWTQMAVDDDPLHRGLCIAFGYVAAVLIGGAYVRLTASTDYRQEVTRVIRDSVKQQLALVKVCLFVFVEIVVFPATCGALLNLVTLPLFPQATLAGRLAFHLRAPLSAFFISWITGTLFMFVFASSIDLARGAVRPGLVWFIRDPQATEFHPIREILERSSRTQARKIATSALLYGVVIASTFGTTILFLKLSGILPLRWPTTRQFSLPVDLIVYHFIVPLTLRAIGPRARVRVMLLSLTKATAHALRLSSFIFGDRDAEEEGTHVRRTWHARLTFRKADINHDLEEDEGRLDPGFTSMMNLSQKEVVFRRDGGFGRVPAIDTVRVAPKRPMLVRVTEEGYPLSDAGAKTIAAQLMEMATTRKNDSYRVVYIPPDFRARVGLFIYLLWFTSTLALCSAIIAPLLTGRYLFAHITQDQVHDLYSIVLGGYVLGGLAYLFSRRAALLSPAITGAHLKAARALITFVALVGFVLPTLVSFTALAFIRLPFLLLSTSAISRDSPPTIHLLHCWAIGTVVLSILYRLGHTFLPRPHQIRIDHDRCRELFAQGSFLSAGAAAELVNSYLLGLARRMVIQLAAPYALSILWTASLSPHSPAEGRIKPSARVIAAAYALTGVVFAAGLVGAQGKHLARDWVQRKLEETYLVEKRLRNFEKVVNPAAVVL